MVERSLHRRELGVPQEWPVVPEPLIARTVWAARQVAVERVSPFLILNARMAGLIADALHELTTARWPRWDCVPVANGVLPRAFEVKSEGRSGD
jgi:hypothetical protein